MMFGFLYQFQITLISFIVQFTTVDGHLDCTGRFSSVSAIPEMTSLRQFQDIRETLFQPSAHFHDTELPHPRIIDHHCPIIEDNQLTSSCCMSSLSVLLANCLCPESRSSDEVV